MQRAYITELYEIIKNDKRVVSLLSDSGTDYDEMLRREFPDQCLNFGICEEHKVAAASGMAMCGKIPFVYTTGAFLAYRSFEFIRNDVCFQNANVKIVGMGSGLAWSTLGPSHHTTEDISVLRALPNLTIFSPASPLQLKRAMREAYKIEGPVYIRSGMSGEREVYDETYELIVGNNDTVRNGKDAVVFCTGSIIDEVIKASELLKECGIDLRIINVSTIKPFDNQSVTQVASQFKYVFTVEEHNINGGLGSLVSDVIAQKGLGTSVIKIGLNDCFAEGYGTQAQLRALNGIDGESIFETVFQTYKP